MTHRESILSDPEIRRIYEQELLFGEATETISGLMISLGLTQRELARRLGVSESRVSQLLSGAENLTLRTLADVGWALGVEFELNPVPMANRAGTPAMDDPPAPAWLSALREQEPRIGLVYEDSSIEPSILELAPISAEMSSSEDLALAA